MGTVRDERTWGNGDQGILSDGSATNPMVALWDLVTPQWHTRNCCWLLCVAITEERRAGRFHLPCGQIGGATLRCPKSLVQWSAPRWCQQDPLKAHQNQDWKLPPLFGFDRGVPHQFGWRRGGLGTVCMGDIGWMNGDD